MAYQIKFHKQFNAFNVNHWDALSGTTSPFLSSVFLVALEHTHCVGKDTGWLPYHLGIYENDQLVAAMPGYIKEDSYGEYVFDHAWANAYYQHGMNYYPKWVSAIPFTPVPGSRLLVHPEANIALVIQEVQNALTLLSNKFSSAHILFPSQAQINLVEEIQLLPRHSVQFLWHNYDYQSFAEFLNALTSRKRKSIRKTRQLLKDRGVVVSRYTGKSITQSHIQFFYRCYRDTYLKRSGHDGYLNKAFFEQLLTTMNERMLIVEARLNDVPIASSLFFFDSSQLYGRYWGCIEDIDELHFECCYFQGIEFAIAEKLQSFNPGTQGEHKILRGFEPSLCFSLHRLFQPEFHQAVEGFLQRETPAIKHYFEQTKTVLPFNASMRERLICNKSR